MFLDICRVIYGARGPSRLIVGLFDVEIGLAPSIVLPFAGNVFPSVVCPMVSIRFAARELSNGSIYLWHCFTAFAVSGRSPEVLL